MLKLLLGREAVRLDLNSSNDTALLALRAVDDVKLSGVFGRQKVIGELYIVHIKGFELALHQIKLDFVTDREFRVCGAERNTFVHCRGSNWNRPFFLLNYFRVGLFPRRVMQRVLRTTWRLFNFSGLVVKQSKGLIVKFNNYSRAHVCKHDYLLSQTLKALDLRVAAARHASELK